MIRSKWLLLALPLSPKEVVKGLLNFRFTMDAGQGFEPISQSNNMVHSRHIERFVAREIISDPFGQVTEVETVRYNTVDFRLHARADEELNYALEVVSPGRTVRPLLDALSGALGRITVAEVNWPLLDLHRQLKAQSPRARIVKVSASGISAPTASALKVEVISASDAFADYRRMFPDATNKIDKIRIERPFLGASGYVELKVNGLCAFDEATEDFLRALLIDMT